MISSTDKNAKKQPRVCNELTDEEKNWLMDCSNFETKAEPKKVHKKKSAVKTGPRKPLSAYNFFFREQKKVIARERATARLAKVDFEALGKLIGGRWKAIHPVELIKFKQMAEADRMRYKQEMEAYLRNTCPVSVAAASTDSEEAGPRQPITDTSKVLSLSSNTTSSQDASPVPKNSLTKQLLQGRRLQEEQERIEVREPVSSSIEPIPVSSFGIFHEVDHTVNQDIQLLSVLESCLNDELIPLEITVNQQDVTTTCNDCSWMEPTPIAPQVPPAKMQKYSKGTSLFDSPPIDASLTMPLHGL